MLFGLSDFHVKAGTITSNCHVQHVRFVFGMLRTKPDSKPMCLSLCACCCWFQMAGYVGNGLPGGCQDQNECTFFSPCASLPNTVCNNTVGSFNCPCTQGFVFNNTQMICVGKSASRPQFSGGLAMANFGQSSKIGMEYILSHPYKVHIPRPLKHILRLLLFFFANHD